MTKAHAGSGREIFSRWADHITSMVSGTVLLVTRIPSWDAETSRSSSCCLRVQHPAGPKPALLLCSSSILQKYTGCDFLKISPMLRCSFKCRGRCKGKILAGIAVNWWQLSVGRQDTVKPLGAEDIGVCILLHNFTTNPTGCSQKTLEKTIRSIHGLQSWAKRKQLSRRDEKLHLDPLPCPLLN